MKIPVKTITAYRVVCPYCKKPYVFTSIAQIDEWKSEHVYNEDYGCSANPKTKKCASCANAIRGGMCKIRTIELAFVRSIYGNCSDWVCKKSMLKYGGEE